jgi:hypothetical protein
VTNPPNLDLKVVRKRKDANRRVALLMAVVFSQIRLEFQEGSTTVVVVVPLRRGATKWGIRTVGD